MAIKTYTEQLEEVQAAITAIRTGSQSYSISGGVTRTVQRGDLGRLQEEEKYLRKMAARETRGGLRVFSVTPTQ